ncbi:MAG: response regulator transcription factor [Nitrospirae bacterium]|nr:response regulator transcription factor [Nitrospirota bacterium]
MAREKILVVDDEKDIGELIEYNLGKEGYRVITAYDGEEVLKRLRGDLPQLILLDIMLPGIDGLEVCRILKRDPRTSGIPIIMLTAKGEEADIVAGLELGADDYVTKPFKVRELLARVRTVLRRLSARVEERKVIKVGALGIDSTKHEVVLKGKPLELTSTEFNLLKCLASNPGRVFTRAQLLNKVWGEEKLVIDRTVDVHIRRLRQKLRSASSYIITVRGVGYKFVV